MKKNDKLKRIYDKYKKINNKKYINFFFILKRYFR